jgi:predicted phage replisome organizer
VPTGKRYYWLKLKEDFFSSKRIKKMRKMAGGDTYTIIYLKLQLLAMKKDGILTWTGLEDDVASELALDIDEAPEDVSVTLMYLLSCGLAETADNVSFFFPYSVENTGSETADAERMRNLRKRSFSPEEVNNVQQEVNNVRTLSEHRYGEIEKEIEIEIEKEKDIDKGKPRRFTPPTLEEVEAYVKERSSSVDAKRFWEYYEAGGWKDSKGNAVKNWKQKLLTWERKDGERNGTNQSVSGGYNSATPISRHGASEYSYDN